MGSLSSSSLLFSASVFSLSPPFTGRKQTPFIHFGAILTRHRAKAILPTCLIAIIDSGQFRFAFCSSVAQPTVVSPRPTPFCSLHFSNSTHYTRTKSVIFDFGSLQVQLGRSLFYIGRGWGQYLGCASVRIPSVQYICRLQTPLDSLFKFLHFYLPASSTHY